MGSTNGTGLTAEQVSTLREEVAAGRAPRVHVDGSQFAAGTAGTVKRVGDPAVDGDDFITVRLKINGVTDELLFGPKELTRGPRRAGKPPAQTAKTVKTAKTARSTTTRTPAPRRPTASPTRAATAAVVATSSPPVAKTAPARAAARKAGRRAGPSAPVTITINSVDATWSVTARRGSRSVLKNAAVNPGAVAAIAALLDQPGLEEAVAAVNDTARLEAESRAEQLRAELAQIQAVLDSHRRP
jgi:hypothetical protein